MKICNFFLIDFSINFNFENEYQKKLTFKNYLKLYIEMNLTI